MCRRSSTILAIALLLVPISCVGCWLFAPATANLSAGIVDANGNGMDDSWESEYGVSDPNADPDQDTLKNGREFELRSDPRVPNSALPAFPGAEGYGAYGFGGRGRGPAPRVFRVTTLQDSGPGSLREAINASGPRFVVFNVGGTILCDSELRIENPFITIAGQTAPPPGITIAHRGLDIKASDVIIRGIRIRIYFDENKDWLNGQYMDCISMHRNDFEINSPELDAVSNVVLDHCSFSWATDENMDTWNWVRNFTVQYCIIAEGSQYGSEFGPQSYGWLTDRDASSTDPGTITRGTLHHNLFIHNAARNPSFTNGNTFDYRNNVCYNWASASPVELSANLKINVVGNYYIAGIDVSNVESLRNVIKVKGPFESPLRPKMYLEGNIAPRRANMTVDEWLLGVAYYRLNTGNFCNVLPSQYCSLWVNETNERSLFDLGGPALTPPVTTQDAAGAKDLVMQKAGCTAPVRDAVDQALVNEVNYVLGTNAFAPRAGYNPATDPQIKHVGPHWGPTVNVLWFKPTNDPGFSCQPRMYRIKPGQTELAAKLEMLGRMTCTFSDGISLPGGAAQILANPAVYQWEVKQYVVPDLSTIQGLYPPSGPGPADGDGDGIPDAAEGGIGTNPGVFDSLGDANNDGYLNIENYINGLIP